MVREREGPADGNRAGTKREAAGVVFLSSLKTTITATTASTTSSVGATTTTTKTSTTMDSTAINSTTSITYHES